MHTRAYTILFPQIELSVSQDYSVHFGDKVLIKCMQAKDQVVYSAEVLPRKECVVAINTQDPMALMQRKMTSGIVATGSMDRRPNQRNVFTIERYLCNRSVYFSFFFFFKKKKIVIGHSTFNGIVLVVLSINNGKNTKIKVQAKKRIPLNVSTFSPDNDRLGAKVRYGEPFYLCTVGENIGKVL
jgi:hypothetical protein